MTSTPKPRTRSELALLVGLALAIALVAALAGSALTHLLSSSAPEPVRVTEELRSTPDVLQAVQSLARLETTRFHMEKVIDLRDHHDWLFGMLQGDDSILLVAAGDVVAGVDLARLRPADVQVDEATHTARVVLPAPEVLSAALDNERTFVFSRETDLLARRSRSLETRARQAAERSIRDAAVEAGILERAGAGARGTVGGLLRGLGFTQVDVRLATDER
jgi:hypothetical protein